MQLEDVVKKLIRFLKTRLEALSMSVTSGGVDSMEKYRYSQLENSVPKSWVNHKSLQFLKKAKMQLETVVNKLLRFLRVRIDSLSMSVTSGGVDNMENYKYIIGQINAYEATLQEISNLLEDKEQNEGTVININTKQ